MGSLLTISLLWQVANCSEVIYEYAITVSTPDTTVFQIRTFSFEML